MQIIEFINYLKNGKSFGKSRGPSGLKEFFRSTLTTVSKSWMRNFFLVIKHHEIQRQYVRKVINPKVEVQLA